MYSLESGSPAKVYKVFRDIDDSNMIILLNCSSPIFSKNPAARELMEGIALAIVDSWIHRNDVVKRRLLASTCVRGQHQRTVAIMACSMVATLICHLRCTHRPCSLMLRGLPA